MAHFAQSPSFILHQVTCQFPTGDTLFGPLNLSLEPSLCALVGRNGSGKTRLLRLLAGLDVPASGHIERFGPPRYAAQQHNISPYTTLAQLLGYEDLFAARRRIDSGDYLPEDLERLDGYWDLTERLSEAFIGAGLAPFDPDRLAAELSGGERVRALLCGAFTANADSLLLDEPTNHLDRQGRAWFYEQLARHAGCVLVASHDRWLLAQVPRILELSASRHLRMQPPSANAPAPVCKRSMMTACAGRRKPCARWIVLISPRLSALSIKGQQRSVRARGANSIMSNRMR